MEKQKVRKNKEEARKNGLKINKFMRREGNRSDRRNVSNQLRQYTR